MVCSTGFPINPQVRVYPSIFRFDSILSILHFCATLPHYLRSTVLTIITSVSDLLLTTLLLSALSLPMPLFRCFYFRYFPFRYLFLRCFYFRHFPFRYLFFAASAFGTFLPMPLLCLFYASSGISATAASAFCGRKRVRFFPVYASILSGFPLLDESALPASFLSRPFSRPRHP